MKINDYDTYIFDVDGTLYSQNKVRLFMVLKLFHYYIIRLWKISDLILVYNFRKLREEDKYKTTSLDDMCAILALENKRTQNYVYSIINKWMLVEPNNLLKRFQYQDVKNFINRQFDDGKKIIVYSDYPAKDKLISMNISYNKIYYFGDGKICELKPSKLAMEEIIKDIKGECLYVGDRDEKDEVSALIAKLDYCDIKQFRKLIKNEYTI